MICKHCGHENPDNQCGCNKCGKLLREIVGGK